MLQGLFKHKNSTMVSYHNHRADLVGVSLKDLAKPSKINGLQAASKGFYPEKSNARMTTYKNFRISTASCSSRSISRFAISRETSSAALY